MSEMLIVRCDILTS